MVRKKEEQSVVYVSKDVWAEMAKLKIDTRKPTMNAVVIMLIEHYKGVK